MKAAKRRGRSVALPLLVVLVGATLAILLSPAAAPDNSDPSSYATGNDGTYALYQLAVAVGANPRRLAGTGFDAALRRAGALVEAAPSTAFSAADIRSMVGFVSRGGTLLYALGHPDVDAPVLAALHLSRGGRSIGTSWRERLPLGGGRALTVRTGPATVLLPSGGTTLSLLGPASHPVAVVEGLGRGRAVVLGSEAPISNRLLHRRGNATFALAALGLGRGSPVLFDEIHHGYAAGDGVGELLLGTPLGLGALLAALVLLLFLASSGHRLGCPLPPPELISVRNTDDHIEAVAELYARAGDRRALARRYLEELTARGMGRPAGNAPEGELGRRLGLLTSELETASREPLKPARLVELARATDALQRQIGGESGPDPAPEVRQR